MIASELEGLEKTLITLYTELKPTVDDLSARAGLVDVTMEALASGDGDSPDGTDSEESKVHESGDEGARPTATPSSTRS